MLDLFDILGIGGEHGYVTVKADDSMGGAGMLDAAGSSGSGSWDSNIKIPPFGPFPGYEKTEHYIVKWETPGGITGQSWNIGTKQEKDWHVPGNIAATNQNLADICAKSIYQGIIIWNFHDTNCLTIE